MRILSKRRRERGTTESTTVVVVVVDNVEVPRSGGKGAAKTVPRRLDRGMQDVRGVHAPHRRLREWPSHFNGHEKRKVRNRRASFMGGRSSSIVGIVRSSK